MQLHERLLLRRGQVDATEELREKQLHRQPHQRPLADAHRVSDVLAARLRRQPAAAHTFAPDEDPARI